MSYFNPATWDSKPTEIATVHYPQIQICPLYPAYPYIWNMHGNGL